MKKILLISSIYPGPDVPSNYTPVVHYFAREWVKMGLDIRVIHTSNYFPYLYYLLPKSLKNYISSKKGFALPEKRLNKCITFYLDNVKIHRTPMKKIIPGKNFSKSVIKKAIKDILSFLKSEEFTPDYIIGHWVIPQAELLSILKKFFNCPIALTLHDGGQAFHYYKNYQQLINSIDIWGYRSENIKQSFEANYGVQKNTFKCYSGIPEAYLKNVPFRSLKKIDKFIYVGMLIERKHPDKVITAISQAYRNTTYHLSIIGEGGMKKELQGMIRNLHIEHQVDLLGKRSRTEVMSHLDESDVFIMISEHEVFGLVYIEAMARGCIVVASIGEGMQGIITNGVNGFLCKSGDTNDLIRILNIIRSLSVSERQQISYEAQKTAKNLTDKKVAENYISTIMQLGNTLPKS